MLLIKTTSKAVDINKQQCYFYGMDIKTYLSKNGISQSAFAEMTGVTQGMVWQWLQGLRPVSPSSCVVIEKFTNNDISRRDLRPDDWHEIWPELVKSKSA